MSSNYTFAPSVDVRVERATLGLHALWSRESAMPADVAVMIANLFRSPAADAMRTEANDPKVNLKQAAKFVAQGDIGAVLNAKFTTGFTSWNPMDGVDRDLQTAAAILADASNAANVFQRVDPFLALVARFDEMLPNPRQSSQRMEVDNWFGNPLVVLTSRAPFNKVPGVCSDRFTTALREACACIKRMDSGPPFMVDAAALREVKVRFAAADRAAMAGLPVGDLRCLLLALKQDGVMAVVRRIVTHVRRGSLSALGTVRGLAEMGHGDIGAMVFATLGRDAAGVPLPVVQRASRAQEMRSIVNRHYLQVNSIVSDVPITIFDAFYPNGKPTVRCAPPECLANTHVMLSRRTPQVAGAPAYHDRTKFEKRWAAVTRGLLDGWDWRNCVAAGGAVVRALVGEDFPERDIVFGDIDLFFYGLEEKERAQRVKELVEHVRTQAPPEEFAILLTSKNVTIVFANAPRIQLATGIWSSLDDVLSTVDVDCCAVAYDGATVVMTGRAAAAYASRVNVASASRHAVRGSIHFEMRLWKYAMLHGFAVVDPLHPLDTSGAFLAQHRAAMASYFGGNQRAAQRRAATQLSGLSWLMAADAGILRPTPPKNELAVGNGRTLSQVLEVVTARGFTVSDDYGANEEGYRVALEGEPGPRDPAPPRYQYLPGYGNVYNRNLHHFVPFRHHDCSYQYHPHDWVIEGAPSAPLPPEPKSVIGDAIRAAVESKKVAGAAAAVVARGSERR